MRLKVFIDGQDSGIVETDIEYATKYWQDRAQQVGYNITLKISF